MRPYFLRSCLAIILLSIPWWSSISAWPSFERSSRVNKATAALRPGDSCNSFSSLSLQTPGDAKGGGTLTENLAVESLSKQRFEYSAKYLQARSPGGPRTFSPREWSKRQQAPMCILNNAKTPGVPNLAALETTPSVPKWFVTEKVSDNCGIWKVTKKSKPWDPQNPHRDAFGKLYFGPEDKEKQSVRTKAHLNVDHVFEVKILSEFFVEIMTAHADGPECNSLKEFWNGLNTASTKKFYDEKGGEPYWRAISLPVGGRSRLDSMFKLLASKGPENSPDFPDFAGTDHLLNTMKGDLLRKDWLTPDNIQAKWMEQDNDLPTSRGLDDWVGVLNYIAGAMDLIHDADVAQLFRNTNIRLYLAFDTIDKNEDLCAPELYAEKFKNFMTDRLTNQKLEIEKLYAEIVRDHLKPDSLQGRDRAKWQAFDEYYPSTHFTLHWEALLDWNPTPEMVKAQSVQIMRRDATADACPTRSTPPSPARAPLLKRLLALLVRLFSRFSRWIVSVWRSILREMRAWKI